MYINDIKLISWDITLDTHQSVYGETLRNVMSRVPRGGARSPVGSCKLSTPAPPSSSDLSSSGPGFLLRATCTTGAEP